MIGFDSWFTSLVLDLRMMRALTSRSPKETQGERALFPTEDRRRDHFPVLCCMRAERHLASIPQGSGAEHVAISVASVPNWDCRSPASGLPHACQCPIWVIYGLQGANAGCPLYPPKQTFVS